MKASEAIKRLNEIVAESGDFELVDEDTGWCIEDFYYDADTIWASH